LGLLRENQGSKKDGKTRAEIVLPALNLQLKDEIFKSLTKLGDLFGDEHSEGDHCSKTQ